MQVTRKGNDGYMLLDASEIPEAAERYASWIDSQDHIHEGVRASWLRSKMRQGDESIVAQSEDVLREIEDQVPLSQGWQNIYDVVGSVPVIPTFLAGHPQHMRRRERTSKDNAPLTIYMDLTSSMGISKEHILRRGIVMLALVRVLANVRPVELWVGSSLGGGGCTGTAAWRIETTPMDLARAGFYIADPSMSRIFGYAMAEATVERYMGGFGGAHNINTLKVLAGWRDMIVVPRIHLHDPLTKDPVAWIKRVLNKGDSNDQN